MRAILAALHELVALFVDDGSLAVTALAWLGCCALLAHLTEAVWVGPIFFLGLALLLGINTHRAARTAARR